MSAKSKFYCCTVDNMYVMPVKSKVKPCLFFMRALRSATKFKIPVFRLYNYIYIYIMVSPEEVTVSFL